MTDTRESRIDQACAVPIEEQCEATLAHYERLATVAHEWNNQVPQAIRAWYAKKREAAPIERCPNGEPCGNTETGWCWGQCSKDYLAKMGACTPSETRPANLKEALEAGGEITGVSIRGDKPDELDGHLAAIENPLNACQHRQKCSVVARELKWAEKLIQDQGDRLESLGSAVRRMTPKQLDALRMLNDAFESHDGAPVMQAIITQADYRLLYEALAGGTTGDRIAQELLTPSATASGPWPLDELINLGLDDLFRAYGIDFPKTHSDLRRMFSVAEKRLALPDRPVSSSGCEGDAG